MYSSIPEEWRKDFDSNVTIEELNDELVTLHIPTIVFISVLMLFGVFGNILVLCIYVNYKASTYKSFIVWLACMDLLACLVGKPALIVSMLYPYMSPSEGLCRWSRFLHVFISVSAAFIFLAISFERYRKICYLDMHQLSNKKVNIICLVAAILACLVGIPALFVFGDAKVETGVHNITGIECFIDEKFTQSLFPKAYFTFQLVLCLVAFLAMCIFYIRIWKTLKWHRTFVKRHTYISKSNDGLKNVGEQRKGNSVKGRADALLLQDVEPQLKHEFNGKDAESPDASKLISKPENRSTRDLQNGNGNIKTESHVDLPSESDQDKVFVRNKSTNIEDGKSVHTQEITKMLFIVTVIFILSFLPHLILMIMNSVRPRITKELSPSGVIVYNMFLRTFVINNMANPIVYFICLRSFRSRCFDKFRNILKCCKC